MAHHSPFTIYSPTWLPRLYCMYAATNKPLRVMKTKPSTIPASKGSTTLRLRN
jgi:hypothetical protein